MRLAQTFIAAQPRPLESGEWQRWSVAAAVVVALHVVVALTFLRRAEDLDADAGSPAVMVELAPTATAPTTAQSDLAPGPEQPQTDAQRAQETPEEKPPDLERPPETAAPDPAVPLPEPPKADEKQQEAQDATVPMAPPSAATEAPRAAGPPPGQTALPNSAAVLTWQRTLSAHLQRFKRYPPKAQANHEQGVAMVGFTMDRHGHVVSSHILRSSGSALLDEETLTMLRRAEPLPRPPSGSTDAQLAFVFPIRYTAR
jgi:protein TonB